LAPFSLNATKGVDVADLLYNFDFKDFMEAGLDGFAIFQGYRSNGSVNEYAINNSIGAWEAGFDNFDVYLSPCPKCNKTASQQVQEMGGYKICAILLWACHCALVSFSNVFENNVLWTYLVGC
jgi:hypothetical protein